jgi:hypothetical protein
MPAFQTKGKRTHADLLIVSSEDTDSAYSIFMFRTGPEFGSIRFTLDSATYIIKKPDLFGRNSWPYVIRDAGDMTGTGNHVLYTMGGQGDNLNAAFFVMGQALDDKIDMFYQHPYNEVVGDTLTANADGLEDFMVAPLYPYGAKPGAGSLWVIHGSKKIPVHLNPQFAGVRWRQPSNEAAIEFSPNPVTHGSSVATITWPEAEAVTYEVRNLLGQVVEQGSFRTVAGSEQEQIPFTNLPSCVYYFSALGLHANARTQLLIEN